MDFSALYLTLQVATLATLIDLPVALAISWLLVRGNIRGRIFIDVMVSLPLAIPPVAIGFFLLLLLGRHGPVGAIVHGLLGMDIVFTWVAAAFAAAIALQPTRTRSL